MLPMLLIFWLNCLHGALSGFSRLAVYGQIREDGARRYERLRATRQHDAPLETTQLKS